MGQKWLLRTLSEHGEHETALALALQTTFPSWGHWIAQGATTCWENWSGKSDATHPPAAGGNPPTHNHIFLCGGVGEWLYEHLAGVTPAAPGWARVSVAPKVAHDAGPSAVNATVRTTSGTVRVAWSRGATGDAHLLTLRVRVPVGAAASVTMPAVGRTPKALRAIDAVSGALLWDGAPPDAAAPLPMGIDAVRAAVAPDSAFVADVSAGQYDFRISLR